MGPSSDGTGQRTRRGSLVRVPSVWPQPPGLLPVAGLRGEALLERAQHIGEGGGHTLGGPGHRLPQAVADALLGLRSRPKPRRTTDSNHRYHKWKNLVRGFTPTAANQLWVADITYIPLECGGTCYLHIVTDAYSHKVVGHKVSPSLRASESLDALRQAIAHAVAVRGTDSLDGLVHHSDRGVQYCCDAYIGELLRHGISVSMTEDYNPTDNAVAERVNGIIKQEAVNRRRAFADIATAGEAIGRYIDFYNTRRPHMSIGNNTPETAHAGSGEQKRLWKRKKNGGPWRK